MTLRMFIAYFSEHWLSFLLMIVFLIVSAYHLFFTVSIRKGDAAYNKKLFSTIIFLLLLSYNTWYGILAYKDNVKKPESSNGIYKSIK